jgi:hypothetical protein
LEFKDPQASFVKILTLSLIILVLLVITRLVQEQTYLMSSAAAPKTPAGFLKQEYYLEKISLVSTMTTNKDLPLKVLLKRKNGAVVTNQSYFEYQWSNDYPEYVDLSLTPVAECSDRVKSPCPADKVIVRATEVGYQSATNVRVKVLDKTTGTEIASTSFGIELRSPEMYATISSIYPNGEESFRVGQGLTIRWSPPPKQIDYYNIYAYYYKDGQLKSTYIGSPLGDADSFDWTVPSELKNQKVKVLIEAQQNGYFIARRASDNYFSVH